VATFCLAISIRKPSGCHRSTSPSSRSFSSPCRLIVLIRNIVNSYLHLSTSCKNCVCVCCLAACYRCVIFLLLCKKGTLWTVISTFLVSCKNVCSCRITARSFPFSLVTIVRWGLYFHNVDMGHLHQLSSPFNLFWKLLPLEKYGFCVISLLWGFVTPWVVISLEEMFFNS